ncbi:MAG TPA: aspartyl/asparaginyl beta-hydroxylase domain-containing protein, partial [Planctomycetota bacterium]|nr:aspartyl/asparaginyl beta-hydroxylase domain-containing protein [Planctomycetota bacterium]
KAYGVGITGNLARCPRLAQVLAETPNVLSASFSFLAPGKHIPRHRGPFRGVLRYHLMLSVPPRSDKSPAAVLKVDGHQHHLAAGESLLWDDTYAHAAWNHSESIRIALLLDVLRPRMPWDVAVVSRGIIAAVGTVLRARHSLRALMEGRQNNDRSISNAEA